MAGAEDVVVGGHLAGIVDLAVGRAAGLALAAADQLGEGGEDPDEEGNLDGLPDGAADAGAAVLLSRRAAFYEEGGLERGRRTWAT